MHSILKIMLMDEEELLNKRIMNFYVDLNSKLNLKRGDRYLINKIDKLFNKDEIESKPITYIDKSESLPRYVNPKQLAGFLKAYNQNPILKYTCHTIDDLDRLDIINEACMMDLFSLDFYTNKLQLEFESLEKKYKVSNKMLGLIRAYLTGKDYNGNKKLWSESRVKWNWQNKDLHIWAKNNPNKVPHPGSALRNLTQNKGFVFDPFNSHLNGNRINKFSELVLFFKNMFHIRANNSLKSLIEYVNKISGFDQKVDFILDETHFHSNIELFTTVDQLLQAYKKIVDMAILSSKENQSAKPKIKLSFEEINNKIYFQIHHLNSKFDKTSLNSLQRLGDTHNVLIKKQINGMCDLVIRANFGNNDFAEINLWDTNHKKRIRKRLQEFQGVNHILIFYP